MIDKFRLDELRLETSEKGDLARLVIELQNLLDTERRITAAKDRQIFILSNPSDGRRQNDR